MCLLFFYVNNEAKEDEFRFILVNNRDEYWDRPTKSAEKWNRESCISGFDQQPEKEGGTWFGASFLVRDFLITPDNIDVYAKRVAEEKDCYNGFSLTLIDLGLQGSGCQVYLVTNDKLADAPVLKFQTPAHDFFAVGNSPLRYPWRKMSLGKERFMEILKTHGRDVSTKEMLVDSLFELMFDKTKNMPDPQLESQASTCGWNQTSTEAISSVFVWNPETKYGTRTTTVLLVDGKGNCDYREKTLETPVSTCHPKWSTKSFTFQLQPPNASL
ncbi:transport and Golgi organization protein 2 homolog isoform X2 [Pomacea canaliculata]|uniref:transport and Golgi organization protein 2 homolog isoform X2 n=1 Tax=Pomacea canaliculata TaxID=400727 RepID=UPI000D73F1C8|nr:transport and Golgi organization protein 2 homolog isoform X2 [Pomacea canaliculata]